MTTVPTAKITLSYPLYGADFDSNNPAFLLVGGGGGEGKSGVGNKITLLNASRREELSEVVEVELSRNEDSVTSLAISQSSDTSLTALAGINSSEADQKAGKNEHLRSFKIALPPRKRARTESEKPVETGPSSEALGRAALFTRPQGSKDGVYQRLLRLSPASTTQVRTVGAIATGLAMKGEIVVFRTDSALKNIDTLGRINLDNEEAADLDIWAGEESDSAVLAYCVSHQVFFYALTSLSEKSTAPDPISIYTVPKPEAFMDQARPKLRGLRFLSPKHILLLANRPNRAGADLIVLKLDQLGSLGGSTLQKRLTSSTKAATGLEVCLLSPHPTTGARQIVVAVASQDGAIELLTIDYSPKTGLGRFKPYHIIRDIHPASITRLAFSPLIFPPPYTVPPLDLLASSPPRPSPVIKLSSVSVGQTVVVHTFRLTPHKSTPSPRTTQDDPAKTQYILAPAPLSGTASALQTGFSVTMALLVIGVFAILLQAFVEVRFGMHGGIAHRAMELLDLSPQTREAIYKPFASVFGPADSAAEDSIPVAVGSSVSSAASSASSAVSDLPPLSDVLASLASTASDAAEGAAPTEALLLVADPDSEDGLTHELHAPDSAAVAGANEKVKAWADLSEKSKEGWRERLKAAGHWAEGQGEAVLKGVFFSEVAGVVGALAGGG